MSNKCAPPARDNNGLQKTPDVLTELGHLPGGTGSVLTANKEPSARPQQFVFNALQRALSLTPGYSVQITHEGGRSSRESTKNHPGGWAADFQLIKNSSVVKPGEDPDAYQNFIGGLVGDSLLDNKVVGIGLYSWGVHFDQAPHRQTGKSGVAQWNGWGTPSNPGPPSVLAGSISLGHERAKNGLRSGATELPSDGTSGEAANPEAFENTEAGKQQQTLCDPEGAGSNPTPPSRKRGCVPLSGSAVASAKSMMNNQGLAVPAALTGPLGELSNNPLMSKFEEVSSLAENLKVPDGLITDLTGQLSQTAFGNFSVANLDKTFSSLTGKLSGPLQGITGLTGTITQGIDGITNQIFSNGDLKNFAETFNKVKGAVGVATNLSSVIEQLPGQIFGDAKSIISKLGQNVFEDIAGMTIDNLAGGITQTLLGDQEQVLNSLLNDGVKSFAAFSSVYKNFDSMVTQGMGSLTSNVSALGRDLKSLGNLGNMQDLLRIGKPGQVVEQIALSGSIAGVQLTEKLVKNGVPLSEINKPENDAIAKTILNEIDSRPAIADAFEKLNIQRSTDSVNKLSDVLDPKFMFPESNDSNYFNELNEASLHLAVCGAQGFEDLSAFGRMLESFETVSEDSNINQNYMPAPPQEMYDLKSEIAPTSDYSGDTDLTIADFIGTAAGYGHKERLKDIKIYMDRINNSTMSELLRELNQILQDTMLGNYTTGGVIRIKPVDDPTFINVNSATGSGARLEFNRIGQPGTYPAQYTVAVDLAGLDYEVGDTFTIIGSLLDGEDGHNNATVTVDSVDIVTGEILGVSVSGIAAEDGYTISGTKYSPIRPQYYFRPVYTSLDDAVEAITDYIDDELDWIETTGADLYGLTKDLEALQRHWEATNSQMYKEAELRESYGISIDPNPRTYDYYGGTGSRTAFPLTKLPYATSDIEVYIEGVKQSRRNRWSYNSTDNQVEFVTAPGLGQEIEIAYTNKNSPPNGSTADVWGLATELEDLGTSTGFGKEADFLTRIATDDIHGSRLKAAMVQSRNRQRATVAGMECPGYNRALSNFYDENPNGFVNFVDLTGIWSDDPGRASEIYLQKQEKVSGRDQYFTNRLNRYAVNHQSIFNRIMQKVLAQLIFYINDNIALTELGTELYSDNVSRDKIIDTTSDLPTTGYVIGPSKEIISHMLETEGYNSEIYNIPLSSDTQNYLNDIDLDLNKLVRTIQDVMLTNAEKYLGLSRTEVTSLFGVPSVSVKLLENIRDNNCY